MDRREAFKESALDEKIARLLADLRRAGPWSNTPRPATDRLWNSLRYGPGGESLIQEARHARMAVLTALAENVSDEMSDAADLAFGNGSKNHNMPAHREHWRRAISAAIRAASQPTGEA